jgi:ribosomal protein L18E
LQTKTYNNPNLRRLMATNEQKAENEEHDIFWKLAANLQKV